MFRLWQNHSAQRTVPFGAASNSPHDFAITLLGRMQELKLIGRFIVFLIGVLFFLPNVCSAQNIFDGLDKNVNQIILVEPVKNQPTKAQLSTWERHGDQWEMTFENMPAVIGRNGFAPSGEKREGDGRTPSGVYKLQRAFGYDPTVTTGLVYKQVGENDFWVDDVTSNEYNLWVTGTTTAKSFERLRREDDLYKYAVVIEYNTDPIVTGNGSAIFLHIWRGKDSSTAGCVAVSEEDITCLLIWLDLKENPVIILNLKKEQVLF